MATLSWREAWCVRFLRGALVAVTCVFAQQAQAQSTANPSDTAARPGRIEEIVVTAERRTTDIQKTAIAITALTPDALQKSNVVGLGDLNGLAPGLEVTKSSGFETVVSIRGVGYETPENSPITTPGVSLFIDGVYIANTISLDQTLFDLDRLEVLRGPQGVLYGQSSIGGAINMITKQPQLGELSGAANVSVGNYDLYRLQGEVNIPINDTMALRVSGQKYSHQGFTKNTEFPDTYLDDADDWSAKGAFLWQPTSNFSLTLTEQYYKAGQNGAAQKNIIDPNPDPRVLSQDYPAKFNLRANLLHLNVEWDLPWATVKSVSAYQYLDHKQQEDGSRTTFAILGAYDRLAAWNTNVKSYTEELDLISKGDCDFGWIVGAFAMHQNTGQFVAEFEGTDPDPVQVITPDIQTNPPLHLNYGNNSQSRKQSFSVFAQGTYQFTDTLGLTLGARYNYDSYDLQSYNFSNIVGVGVGFSTAHHTSVGVVPTFRGELDYNPTQDNLVYFSVSRGYKPGGVNGAGLRPFTPESFDAETNTAFEIGSKNMLFDHSLQANFAGFYYLYKNMQYIATDAVPFVGGIDNIPSVHVYGAEAELSYVSPDSKLRIDGNLSLENGSVQGSYKTLNSTIVNIIQNQPYPSPCAFGGAYYNPACWAAVAAAAEEDIGGNKPAKMPTVSGSATVAYNISVPTGMLTPRIQLIYRGAFWGRMFADPLLDHVPSYAIVNLNLQYVPNDSNFVVSLAVTNVGDKAGVNSRFVDPYGSHQTSQQFIPPRQIIGSVSYNF